MKLYFWIFTIVCVFNAQADETPAPASNDADSAIGTTIKTIAVAAKVVSLHSLIHAKMQWAQFDKVLPDFDNFTKDLSEEAGAMVGGIKTNVMNTIDAHFQASRRMSEWCSLNIPILRTHATLFTGYNAAKAKTQHFLLRKILGDGAVRWNEAQVELDKMSTNIDAGNETLYKLFDQFKKDFDENSEYFQTKVRQNTKSNRVMDKFRHEKEKVTAAFKERFAKVVMFFVNVKEMVLSALIDIRAMVHAIKPEVPIFENLKSQAEKITNFESVNTDPKVHAPIVEAIQNLIAKCTEYAENHKA